MEFVNVTLKEGIEMAKQDGFLLFDVREPYRYKKWHLDGAKNVPYGILDDDLSKEEKLIVYCDFGGQSMMAARHLAMEGYEVYNIVGGVHLVEEDPSFYR